MKGKMVTKKPRLLEPPTQNCVTEYQHLDEKRAEKFSTLFI
jgi:hypothetical protein